MEENTKISGFHSIDTVRFQGFNDSLLTQMEQIISHFYQKAKVQSLLRFYDELYVHLFESPEAHDLNMTPFSEELVQQLYRAFRDRGLHGTVNDMLMAIAKFVDIGSLNDVKLGTSKTKAVNASGWKYVFQKHASNKKAHPPRFELFQPDAAFNVYPSWGFTHLFKELFDIFIEDGYTIPVWNTNEGTFVFEFSYTLTDEWNQIPLFSFTNQSGNDEILCEIVKTAQLGNLIIKQKYKDTWNILFSIPLPTEFIGLNRVVLTYDIATITYRDVHNLVTITVIEDAIHPFATKAVSPISMYLFVPLEQKASPVTIRDLVYYHHKATEQEQVFFLI